MRKWTIVYDNDTGVSDESFSETWEVTDDSYSFVCRDKSDAEWLCNLLNPIFI